MKKTPTILVKLTLERSDILYYITGIKLSTKFRKKQIISYKIKDKYYDKNNIKYNKNKKMDIHHIIKPLTENNKNDKVELEIQIPFSFKENRRITVDFGYDKYPFDSNIVIKLPPNNYTAM